MNTQEFSTEFDTLLNISKIAKYIELEKLGKEVRLRKKRERGIETLNYYHFDVSYHLKLI